MNMDDELEESEIEGFSAEEQTLFCQNAIHDQLVQVQFHNGSFRWLYLLQLPCFYFKFVVKFIIILIIDDNILCSHGSWTEYEQAF